MDHYDVLIATPGAKLEAQYVKSLVETLAACAEKNITFKWLNGYSSLVHHARELTASGGEGLELNPNHKGPLGDTVTYNKIFWIDSDISWTPEQFFKLYDSECDVISGAYLLADGVTTSVHAWGTPGGIAKEEIMAMKEVCHVQSIGFGFVAMRTGVFERMERPWFAHESQKVEREDGSFITDSLGEDISWCVKAYKAGIPVFLDPSVLVTHMKQVAITWDQPRKYRQSL
jgi:hypothetical protein